MTMLSNIKVLITSDYRYKRYLTKVSFYHQWPLSWVILNWEKKLMIIFYFPVLESYCMRIKRDVTCASAGHKGCNVSCKVSSSTNTYACLEFPN